MNKIKTFKKFNSEDIFRYIRNGDIESVKNYIKFGYDLNIQSNDAYTPLSYAVVFKKIEIVKLLLNAGSDLNKQNNIGNTALILASLDNYVEIVELLLNAGADIDKQNNDGETALILAAYENNREIIELLLDYAADEFILNNNNISFYYYLNDKNKKYFTQNYPTSVYNAISHWYKKSFTEFIKDYNIKNNK